MDNAERVSRGFARQAALAEYEQERFTWQLKFAEFLCEQHPEEADEWRQLITEAMAGVEKGVSGDVASLSQAVREAEELLAPVGQAAKEYAIYCVGHAHIDMNWMWSWPETVATTNDTFTTVLRLMDEFPEFVFSQSQASVYRIVEERNPGMLDAIGQRVKEGRWEVTASHWVEGDKNIASGESLCRHLLYTRKYMQDLFGLAAEDVPIDWAPDTFGHAHTMPTYLRRGGIKYTYMHRPGVHTPPQPRPWAFWWQAPDGSRVLVRNDMRLGYNGVIQPQMVDSCLMPFTRETGLKFSAFVFGVGDHGGGPTRRDLVRRADMDGWPIFPEIRHATAREFFERLEKEGENLPVIDDELNGEFSGCYTTQTLIKKGNRFAEKKLVDAETANALTWAARAKEYPAAPLEEGWRDTLFSHFHDILPGSGVHDTRTYTHGLYQKTVAMTGVEEMEALRALAARVDSSAARVEVDEELPPGRWPTAMGSGIGHSSVDGHASQYGLGKGSDHRPYLVFNPLPGEREEVVEAMVWDGVWGWERKDPNSLRFSVEGPDGNKVAAQVLEVGHYWGHQFVEIAFPAKVPGLGYGLYVVKEEMGEQEETQVAQVGLEHPCGYSAYERSPEGLENDLVQVELDPQTGGIRSLVDKRSGVELIGEEEPASVLEYGVERVRSMSAWLVEHTGGWRSPELVALRRGASGPFKATLDAVVRVEQSEFTVTYELRAGDPCIYIHIKGTWFQRGTKEGTPVLRFSAPLALEDTGVRYEIPFGSIGRDLEFGEEVPALRWAGVSGKQGRKRAGVLLLNDSKHGYAMEGNRLCLTLIRSSVEPDPLPEIGEHEIHLGLCPFEGETEDAEAIGRGRIFNHELKVVSTDAHDGEWGASGGLAQVEGEGVVLDAVKKAENEDGLIFRFYEVNGRESTARLSLDEGLAGKIADAVEVDLMERPLGKSNASVEGNSFAVEVPPRGISSVLVRLER